MAPGRETGVTEEAIIATLERNGVNFLGLGAKAKAKKTGRLRAATTLRIDIPATTPARTISMVWEEMVKSSSSRKEGGDYVNKKKLQRAEKMIREAFVHLYKGVGHLNKYRSLITLIIHYKKQIPHYFPFQDLCVMLSGRIYIMCLFFHGTYIYIIHNYIFIAVQFLEHGSVQENSQEI